ncbi:uncharacterized protein LOC119642028 [Glossina fuscipes]|uniref:dual-specificity kinase n=1 Tax=Glossina fuscipes TaxID=7396 RepID=A0A9C6E1I9_9MUSC|nr:uncharacterized protein LOC119642028 [Glossina fuscipes]
MNINQHSGPGRPMKSYAANALNTTLAPSIAIKTCDSSNHFSTLNEIDYKKVAITTFMNTKTGSSTSSMSSPSLSIISSSCSLSSSSCTPLINGNSACKSVCEGAGMTSTTMNISNISSSSNGGNSGNNGAGSSGSSCSGGKITKNFIAPPPLPPAIGCTTSSDRLVTGPSCKALRTAVSALYSVDDFVKEKIGSGFFSEVYKVTHRTTGQVMVLKMNQLRANRPNMLREVQLLNKLSHPNILSFMGVCVQEGQLHALTEYINGGSLEQLLANKEVELGAALKLKLALGIARGMAYVHDAGIFHRDLTSKNVLIRKLPADQYEAVVGDFGLAAKIPDRKCKTRLEYVGSPYWVSPECLKNKFYDERSDVFSFGIISCEIIARIEADPDIMPRTDSFGLDYLAFVELCPMDTPPVFLRLAFYCCIYDPKSRPTFHDVVKKLTLLLEKYQHDAVAKNVSKTLKATSATSTSSSSPLSSLEMTNCALSGSDSENQNVCVTLKNGSARQVLTKKSNSATNTTSAASCVNTASATCLSPRHLREVSDNGFVFTEPNKRISSIPNDPAKVLSHKKLVEDSININSRVRRATKKYEAAAELLMQQHHRRSLSENIIHFPLHTTPSDKARCHQMQRQRSSTHSPTPPPINGSSSATLVRAIPVQVCESPTPGLTLRKVAETMCLKDAQYKPMRTDQNGVKTNPFTALAQLRRVKKVLGANPKTYAAGVGDLFSSCFEMCAPFFKEMAALQKITSAADENKLLGGLGAAATIIAHSPIEPKSLPTSPQLTRKFSAADLKLSPSLQIGRRPTAEDEDDCVEDSDIEQDADGGGNCADAESSSDDSAERPAPAPATRKYRANSLFTHPLFRGSNTVKNDEQTITTLNAIGAAVTGEEFNSSEDGCEGDDKPSKDLSTSISTPAPPAPTSTLPLVATPASISSCPDFELNEIKHDFLPTKSTLTRRDSIESGFYSCFNEESDAATTYRQYGGGMSTLGLGCGGSNCCFEQLKSQLMLDVGANGDLSDKLASLCRCCYYSSTSQGGHHQQLLNDSSSTSSSVLLMDEVSSGAGGPIAVNTRTNTSALRSLDDLELPDATRTNKRYACHHHLLSSNDPNLTATAGLINRLALDSEIHSMMQRSPFTTNQLLYCKNRTSSIYTDSSDDISSLAGSDSLLWDDRSFALPPSTRSAQIAKIVEYFERKRQVPDSNPPPRNAGGHSPASGSGSTSSSSSMAAAVAASYLSYDTRRYSDFKRHATINSDYEAFCFELDKKPSQARLMVCEGAVKSKLQIFDKIKQQHQQNSMAAAAAAATAATTCTSVAHPLAVSHNSINSTTMTTSLSSVTPSQTPTTSATAAANITYNKC